MEASGSRASGSRDYRGRDDRADSRRSRDKAPEARRARSRSPARRRDRSAERPLHRRRSRSRSDSDVSSDDGRSRRHRPRSRSRSRDRESKEERRLRKEAKRERKAKRRERREARAGRKHLGDDYGKHGIIGEGDIFTKQAEFQCAVDERGRADRDSAYLREEKRIEPDHTPDEALQQLFRGFVEDYNLGIFPHDKFYDLERWALRMDAMRLGRDIGDDASYDPNADERAIAAAHRSDRPKAELSREELLELRRIERERVEVAKLRQIGADVPMGFGVRYEMKMVEMPEE